MKKIISERKWNKLYDQATDGFYEKRFDDGSERYTVEGFEKYQQAVMEFPEYRIIGIRHQLRTLKRNWKNHRLRHLKIGKIKRLSKTDPFDFMIIDISRDIHWQTELYLTVIIRDYLRSFIKNTPAIGNCVIEKNDPLYIATDADWKKWSHLVNSVANEFDGLIRLMKKMEHADDISNFREEYKKIKKKAFSDLAFIYEDLTW